MNDVRLFVAIPAPLEMQQDLVAAGLRLKQRLTEAHSTTKGPHTQAASAAKKGRLRVRLIPPENMHLTLYFLGDTAAGEIPAVEQQLAAVAKVLAPPRFRAAAGGVFPARGTPRVAWCGVDDPDNSLRSAANAVAGALGRRLERLRPHFTLGYLKGPDVSGIGRPAVAAACLELLQAQSQTATHEQEPRYHVAHEMV
ncbi:MAG: 2'-5' RNA ligase family protein, partial [Spirochaetia bacterium]